MWWNKRDRRIRTYTGKLVNAFNLQVEDVCLEDCCHSLTLQTRFTGHSVIHLPIAAHSLLVAFLCPSGYKLDGLCHDCSEAYFNDISSPIKGSWRMWFYKRFEKGSQRVICEALGTRYPIPEEVHRADKIALQIEQYLFMTKGIHQKLGGGQYIERYDRPFTWDRWDESKEHYGVKFMKKLTALSMIQIEQLFKDSYWLYKEQEGLE